MIRKLLKNFKAKLLISFILVLFPPIIILSFLICQLYANSLLKNIESNSISSMNLICDNINSLIDDTYSICHMLTKDIKIQQHLRQTFNSLSEQYSSDLSCSMDLTSISTYKKNIYGIYILGDNNGQYKSNYCSFKPGDLKQTHWYQNIHSSDNILWFPPQNGSFIVRSSLTDRFFTMGMPITDKSSGKTNGVVLAEIKEEELFKNINNTFNNGAIYILDKSGNILFNSSDAYYELSLQPELKSNILSNINFNSYKPSIISDKNYIIVNSALKHTDWCIIGMVNRNLVKNEVNEIFQIILLFLSIILFLSFCIAVTFSNYISKPVHELYHMMNAVEKGDFSVRINKKYNDEFDTLNASFNKMLSRIQELIDQIYDEQKKLKTSELKTLQAQIQPHFLYNSLDSIIWLLRMNRTNEAENMLSELSTFFKISLSKGKEVIKIKDELQHVKSYLTITTMIYNQKFEYSIDCDPTLYDYQTIKLILQPLVENIILHAVPIGNSKIFIYVHIFEHEKDIILSVQDFSMGIDEEKLRLINDALQSSNEKISIGYGLYNVNKRVNISYGLNYGLTINSEYGFGTEVYIKIPKIKGEDNIV